MRRGMPPSALAKGLSCERVLPQAVGETMFGRGDQDPRSPGIVRCQIGKQASQSAGHRQDLRAVVGYDLPQGGPGRWRVLKQVLGYGDLAVAFVLSGLAAAGFRRLT